MKKLFALVLAMILALGCTAALAEQYTIYLVTMDLEDMHWVSVNEGAEAAIAEAKEAGVDVRYVWVGPTVGKNDAAQIECINNAYADNADVILLASNGPETEVETIERYDADGVKFVYVDSPANSDVALCTLATDNTEAGRMAARTLLEALEAAGITEGKIGIVNINTSTVSTQYRENGFREVFEGTNYEILETQYGEGRGQVPGDRHQLHHPGRRGPVRLQRGRDRGRWQCHRRRGRDQHPGRGLRQVRRHPEPGHGRQAGCHHRSKPLQHGL